MMSHPLPTVVLSPGCLRRSAAVSSGTDPDRRRRACASGPRYLPAVDVLGLDHVHLAAPRGCESAARAFFGELLGLPEIDKSEALRGRGGAWFAAGAQQLHIGVEDFFTAARKAHPALRIADLDGLVARLAADGVAAVPDAAVPGVRRVYVVDPWGNRLKLVQA